MQKLKAAIEKYLAADTLRKQAGAKGAITRLVNERAKEIGASLARDEVQLVLKEFEELPHWLTQRFTLGSLYQEGDRIFGWWSENQAQAEELPLYREAMLKAHLF